LGRRFGARAVLVPLVIQQGVNSACWIARKAYSRNRGFEISCHNAKFTASRKLHKGKMPKIFHFLGITLMHELHAIYASNKIFSKCDSVGMLDGGETNRRRKCSREGDPQSADSSGRGSWTLGLGRGQASQSGLGETEAGIELQCRAVVLQRLLSVPLSR